MTHVMVDCETLGLRAGSVVLSIGATIFLEDDKEAGGRTFYQNVDVLSSILYGLTIDVSTVDWWRKQSPEARAALTERPAVPLGAALATFSEWWGLVGGDRVWANGPLADVVWLEHAYAAVGVTPPWTYRQVRDYRTVVDLMDPDGIVRQAVGLTGAAHDALADAVYQARVVERCLRK
jgi:exodeoxyribonuclease VIII